MPSTRSLPIDATFERRYAVELIDGPPASLHDRYDFDLSGPSLKVSIDGEEPIVIVVPGDVRTMRIQTLPDPYAFLVLPAAFYVNLRAITSSAHLDLREDGGSTYSATFPDVAAVYAGQDRELVRFKGDGSWDTGSDLPYDFDPEIEVAGNIVTVTAHSRASHKIERFWFDRMTGRPIVEGP